MITNTVSLSASGSNTAAFDSAPAALGERLYFLDWVRIFAFALLICYHVGMYYVSWGWHIKSETASHTLEPLMFLTNPWRMSLLFLVSGVATRFMLERQSAGQFAGARSWRILLPLIFGMAVIVPPQAYLEVVQKLQYQGSYLEFLNLYFHNYRGFFIEGKRLVLPTWNHLWFLAYLWTYSMIIALAWKVFPAVFAKLEKLVDVMTTGWGIFLSPILYLAAIRIGLLSGHPPTNNLTNDWYNHANYFFYFLMGFFLARNMRFWNAAATIRWKSLMVAILGWIFIASYMSYYEQHGDAPLSILYFQRVVWVMLAWTAILALCGFARQHWNRDHAKRELLTTAVFPLYILHQTVIILLAWQLRDWRLTPIVEGPLLVFLCFAFCYGIFLLVRRIPLLRPMMGMTAKPNKSVFVVQKMGNEV